MRKKQVWRYYCEFCSKANCSGPSISKHEQHCTLNPNRICRMCSLLDQKQPDLHSLISLLPSPTVLQEGDLFDWLEWSPNIDQATVLANLRKAAGNCPACILAALRQAKIPVPMMEGFSYCDESRKVRDDYYSSRNADEYEWAY